MLQNFGLKELKQDNRGEICLLQMRLGGYEVFLSHTKKGVARGGYFFKPNKYIKGAPSRIYIVVSGKFTYKETDIASGHEMVKEIKVGEFFATGPNVAHIFIALEDCDMIEFTPGSKGMEEMVPYPPYRELAEKGM